MDKYLIVVVGPTAIGKTGTAIQIARHFKTEIVNADSRQVFSEMSIGTAKPDQQELEEVPHHLVGHISIHDRYSAGDFEREALQKINDLFISNQVVVLSGGSGMYVDAVCYGLDQLPHDEEIRNELNSRLKEQGIESLQQQLKELDFEHYEKMDIQNPHRLIRALEVCLVSGQKYSSLRKNSRVNRPFNIIKLGLEAPRELIYDRINKRVDQMIDSGLLEEIQSLRNYKDLNALNTVGYKELFSFYEGDIESLEDAVELIKMNTRRFAKRQLTWYRKDQDINWFKHDDREGMILFCETQISNPRV